MSSILHRSVRGAAFTLTSIAFTTPLLANHGPGTSGGGSSTASGETLKQGMFDVSLRTDYTEFEHVTEAEAIQRALAAGGFDGLARAFVTTLSAAYGATNDLQFGAQIGYYAGTNFIAADPDGMGGADVGTADPSGLTDLWLSSKWRVMHGQPGNLALMFGLKLPTGRDNVLLSNGEKLEASSQPGTGAVDGQLGIAYSRFLTSQLTLDASFAYTLRGTHDDFTVGDRVDTGLALAYRLTEDIKKFPNYSVSAELLDVFIGKDDDHGDLNPNSGGNTLYISPGFRTRFDEHTALSIAGAVPIAQDLNGDQIETRYKAAITLSFGF
jgi:hypothetical protein